MKDAFMRMNKKCRFLFLVAFLLVSSVVFGQKQLKIGVISDFDPGGNEFQTFLNQIEREIQNTLGSAYQAKISNDLVKSASWDMKLAQKEYASIETEADLILLLGSVSIGSVVDKQEFSVPTIGVGVFDAQMQHVPLTEKGSSGVKNFSYILTSQPFKKELADFHDIVPFKNLTIIADQRQLKAFDSDQGRVELNKLMKEFGSEFDFILLGDTISESLNKIKSNTDAVHLAIPYGRSDAEIKQIADELIKRKLPSYTMSQDHVQQGIMACKSGNNGLKQIFRKMALLAEEAITGSNIGDSKVALSYEEKLYINIGTAEAIDFSPSFDIMFSAELIGEKKVSKDKVYSISQIVSKAIEVNLDIKVSEQQLELAKKDYAIAKSEFLPRVDVSATALQIDHETADNSNGTAPETKITGSGSLEQIVYSESVIANIKINEYLAMAEEYALEQQMVDVIFSSFQAYFNILKAKTNIAIQQENLNATTNNLELAKVRVFIGASGKDELYRWESEAANSKQALIEAQIQYYQGLMQLNMLLNNELGEEYDVEDAKLDDAIFTEFNDSRMGKYLQSPAELELFSKFLVQEGIENYPSEKQIRANQSAIERQLTMNKRLFYTPTVAIQGQANNIFDRSGAGSEPVSFIPGVEPNDPIDFSWNVAVSASLPIFQKNQRRLNTQRTMIQLDQLGYQKRSLDQNVEFAIRSRMLDVVGSGTNVNFSKISSENSEKNFKIVQDNYKKGTVSIIQLIDAQKAALSARQAYANSVYNYLLSFIALENSLGRYSILTSDEERNQFIQRYIQFIQENN